MNLLNVENVEMMNRECDVRINKFRFYFTLADDGWTDEIEVKIQSKFADSTAPHSHNKIYVKSKTTSFIDIS